MISVSESESDSDSPSQPSGLSQSLSPGLSPGLSQGLRKPSFVYFLISTKGSTYIGATVDLNHRLRQHNREIKGGAHATSARVLSGETWQRVCYVSGFPDWTAALQFEWRWKQISRKQSKKMKPLERRLISLRKLLDLDRPTTKAITYNSWSTPPVVNFEDDWSVASDIFSVI